MIPPVFKFLPKHENMESIYPVSLSSKLAIKTLAGWGKKILDILFSCNTRTVFSDRNSGPKLCAVSIANDGMIHFDMTHWNPVEISGNILSENYSRQYTGNIL